MNRPTQWWHYMPDDYAPTPVQPMTVFQSDPVSTGLLDVDGNPIMRTPDRIGFLKGADK